MANELCPRCGVIKNMIISTSKTKMTDFNGKKENVETKTFHCEACNSFLRSEEVNTPES